MKRNTTFLVVSALAAVASIGARTLSAQAPATMPQSATEVLSAALARAKAEKKTVLVEFGGEGCIGCQRLKAFLEAPSTKAIVDAHYVIVELKPWDGGRTNPGSEALMRQLGGGNGIPFSALLDSTGRSLIAGGVPGYASSTARIATWEGYFQQTAPRMTALERKTLVKYLNEHSDGRGSINGRVIGDNGLPLGGASVLLTTRAYSEGQWKPSVVAKVETNESGFYQLADLQAGDYRLVAEPRVASADMSAPLVPVYAPTFYPGATSVAGATPVTIERGEDASGLNVSLARAKPRRVAGIVVGSAGTPAANAAVTLTEVGWPLNVHRATTRIDGTFAVPNVRPATYNIWARTGAAAPPELGSRSIVIAESDVDGVRIATVRGATMVGKVMVTGSPLSPADHEAITITAIAAPRATGAPSANPQARPQDDGRFELRGMAGPRVIRVLDLPQGWALESVWRGDTNVTDRPLDLAGTELIVDIRVVITSRTGVVTGTVTNPDRRPMKAAAVIVFADQSERWVYPSRFVRAVPMQQQGEFTIRGLLAGRYLIAPVESLERGWDSPESLARLRSRATSFDLIEAERRIVVIPFRDGGK